MGAGGSSERDKQAEQESRLKQLVSSIESHVARLSKKRALADSMKANRALTEDLHVKIIQNESKKDFSEQEKKHLTEKRTDLTSQLSSYKQKVAELESDRIQVYTEIGVEKEIMKRFADQYNDKKASLVVAIGQVGDGKSTFCNRFSGDQSKFASKGKFRTENSNQASQHRSVTHMISSVTTSFEKNGKTKFITIVDTPGAGDTENKDEENNLNLIRFLRGCGGVNAFLIFYNLAAMRFSGNYQKMIKMYEKILGRDVWKHVIIVATKADQFSLSKEDDIDWQQEKESVRNIVMEKLELKEEFDDDDDENSLQLPVVFINNVNNKVVPDFDAQTGIKELLQLIPDKPYECGAIECKLEKLEVKKKSIEKELKEMNEKLDETQKQLNEIEINVRVLSSKDEDLKQNEAELMSKAMTLSDSMASDMAAMLGVLDPDTLKDVVEHMEGRESEERAAQLSNDKDDLIKCPKCDALLKYRPSNAVYGLLFDLGDCYLGAGTGVTCDNCQKDVMAPQQVYHCPKGKTEHHEAGFDLCVECATKMIKDQANVPDENHPNENNAVQ